MSRPIVSSAAFVLAIVLSTSSYLRADETVPLSTLDLHKMRQGWGEAKIDQSVTGKPLTIGSETFAHGVGTHAQSVFFVQLNGGTKRFTAKVGVDSSQVGNPGTVEFRVIADGKTLFRSGVMKPGDAAKTVDVDLSGVKLLLLFVGSAGDGISYDHANWADAKFVVSGEKPKAIDAPREEAVILTPRPSPKPRINGPAVYGCRPGNPFIYRIPTTGRRPMTFAAENLPDALQLGRQLGHHHRRESAARRVRGDASRGKRPRQGREEVQDRKRRHARANAADGLEHWYAHYNRVTDKLLREAADVHGQKAAWPTSATST